MFQIIERTLVLGVLLLILLSLTQAPLSAKNATKNASALRADLRKFSFLTGTWRASDAKETTEEIWGAVQGDSIVGHCQSVSSGKSTLYELMVILKSGDNVVMRIKHFKEGFVPWTEEAEAGDFKLIKLNENEMIFQNEKPEQVTVSYKRNGAQLEASVKVLKNGKSNNFPFTYKLISH